MKNSKPMIGLTANIEVVRGNISINVHLSYSEAIKKAGGIPVILPLGNLECTEKWMKMVDGLFLTGGNDVDPRYFYEEPHPYLGPTIPQLDHSDMELLKRARLQNKPIFGICRGSHLINIALGGSMIQHIEEDIDKGIVHLTEVERTITSHPVKIQKDSRLYELLREEVVQVNSFHHQAIGRLADGLRAVAKADDGVIEAYESQDTLIMGTQFHPEELGKNDDRMQRILVHFVEQCRVRKLKN
ncbi:gamma-glutamyl-gamma-aminobutyrate hydrolase family protein [Peribacillus alkalitolerans]|uniref:gamma-glutamyl-gamma-aminobutyrate hydrolase family protein n=1 Tax=Peribacillus alkalitolerans TaxID=1550385 RepID=UPI0013CFC7D8|nr:gamma-glutamyl-gamma-aminobutyrate hydrolase family protein [Peribacillus alkalitolerans]